MCESCKPFDDLTEDELNDQIERLTLTFVGLPMVTGAPLIVGAEHWREVARHQIELGVRICAKPIKDYVAPEPGELRSAGKWVYDEQHRGIETAEERVREAARKEWDAYMKQVDERRKNGTLKTRRPEFGDPVKAAPRKPRKGRKK